MIDYLPILAMLILATLFAGLSFFVFDVLPPGSRVTELRMFDLVLVPGEAVPQVWNQLVTPDLMPGLTFVKRFEQAAAPQTGTKGKGSVKVPENRALHTSSRTWSEPVWEESCVA